MSQPYLGSPGAQLKPTPSSFGKLAWSKLLDANGSFKSHRHLLSATTQANKR